VPTHLQIQTAILAVDSNQSASIIGSKQVSFCF
jgi:hypothetical protein